MAIFLLKLLPRGFAQPKMRFYSYVTFVFLFYSLHLNKNSTTNIWFDKSLDHPEDPFPELVTALNNPCDPPKSTFRTQIFEIFTLSTLDRKILLYSKKKRTDLHFKIFCVEPSGSCY